MSPTSVGSLDHVCARRPIAHAVLQLVEMVPSPYPSGFLVPPVRELTIVEIAEQETRYAGSRLEQPGSRIFEKPAFWLQIRNNFKRFFDQFVGNLSRRGRWRATLNSAHGGEAKMTSKCPGAKAS